MNHIILRALSISDLDKTLEWNNREDISYFYSGHPFPINREMEQKWYEKILTSNIPITVFGIELIENKKLIGISVLKEINLINRSSEFALYIGDIDYRGKGLSKEACLLTLQFAFYKLGMNRIYLKVLETNEVALKLYISLGFIKEGVLRNCVFKDDVFHSEIIMSILRNEFNGRLQNPHT